MPPSRRTVISTTLAAAASASAATAPAKRFYEQWDVFTQTRLTGNPLAVFLDATGFTDAQMLAIARETNLSETTFIFPKEPGHRVRIFTREQELPFAGHPTLGTAAVLRAHTGKDKITLRLNAGEFTVEFDKSGYGEMVQQDAVAAELHDVAAIAPLLGLSLDDFDTAYPIQNLSTGRPNLIVMLKSLVSLGKAAVNWPAAAQYFADGDRQRGFYLLTREVLNKQARVHARKPTRGGDDPATGAAAGPAAAYLVRNGIAKPNERVLIEQGTEIGRPSQIYVSADGLRNIRVGGYCVKAMEGSLLFG
ncbi:phenazine biosynthesis protein PhzF [Bryobacterales bacterium F-183]|nr:phenazine biosynthesis protein PhzF [Bryobacterales bacterium F-183]